ncbi:hypothetical protein AYM40_16455 [Paraburkholderia phytofirmans OLGA172]|uniref:Toprim domain-containing protein n=1 Tax=Paraburkholderia phytofirmans OLGA172 TaxID=1417228 RepID=A0A160FMN9_9BURK|nr:DUF927 domain-containing protein [Paraburkholderia phytofirmans]ANB73772.1 hypothetical protein AYM40_16455 [Paraburkholderia phytofirmans OLGA172]
MSAVIDEYQRIEAALFSIPPDIEREQWFRIAAALKHELADTGFDLFDMWSQGAANYSASDARDTWRSLSAGGGITISTLFFVAIEHGFDSHGGGASTVDSAEMERRRAEREKRAEQEARDREIRAISAAGLGETVWRAATPARADHPYLTRKGVQPADTLREIEVSKLAALIGYQPKRGDDLLSGRILIAPVKVGGKLSTLEMIDGDGRKSALAGGAKAGGYWAAQKMPDAPEVVLIAEGVATALSASQCTGYPAIASLSVGQMAAAGKAMRECYPDAELVLLADLDKASSEPHETAVKAAQAVGGKLSVPAFGANREPAQTDFNDLHTARGTDVVKAAIEAAREVDAELPVSEKRGRRAPPLSMDDRAVTVSEGDDAGELEPRYAVIDGGLYYIGVKRDKDSGAASYTVPMWLCSELKMMGTGRDDSGQQYRLMEFRRAGSGEVIRHAMPARDIGERDGWAVLRGLGLHVAAEQRPRYKLAEYVQREGGTTWYEIVGLTGWQHGAYVLASGEFVGTPDRPLFYNGGTPKQSAYKPAGSLEAWRDTVGSMARENPLIAASIACAFAGPLLSLIGARDGIGLHLYTTTSSGKSTAGDCAASVWGNPADVMHTWDGTSYGLTRTAEYANDGLLYLDEIGAGDARKIGPAIYQMLNGVSRLQGTKDGGVVASRSWRLTMVSTGEVSMAQYLAEGGQTPRGGQEIRLLDVPADMGAYRAFDSIHGYKDGDVFAKELTAAARANYGTAGRAFVEWLTTHRGEVKDWVESTQAHMLQAVEDAHPDAAPPAKRATRKWGVLVAAAEMASEAALTGWTRDEARTWVMAAWARWLQAFGTHDRDNERLLEQVDGILRANELGRFVLLPIDPAAEPTAHNILGYRRYVDGEPVFLVLPAGFKGEVVAGYELRRACQVLHEAGMLDRGRRDSWTVNAGKPAGMVYRVHPRKADGDTEGGGE